MINEFRVKSLSKTNCRSTKYERTRQPGPEGGVVEDVVVGVAGGVVVSGDAAVVVDLDCSYTMHRDATTLTSTFQDAVSSSRIDCGQLNDASM